MAKKSEWSLDTKKGLGIASIGVGIFGTVLTIILFLVMYFTIDQMEGTLTPQINQLGNSIDNVEKSIETAEGEMEVFASGFGTLGSSMKGIQDALEQTGGVIKTLGYLDTNLAKSGDDLIDASEGFGEFTASIQDTKEGILSFKSELSVIKNDLATHRRNLADIRDTLTDTMGMLKLASFLYLLVNLSMFGMLMLNALPIVMPKQQQEDP